MILSDRVQTIYILSAEQDLHIQLLNIRSKMLTSQSLALKEFLSNSQFLSHQTLSKSPNNKAFSPVKPLHQYFIGKKQKQAIFNLSNFQSQEKLLLGSKHFQNSQSTNASTSQQRKRFLKIQDTKIKLQAVKEKYQKSCQDIKKGVLINNPKKIGLKNKSNFKFIKAASPEKQKDLSQLSFAQGTKARDKTNLCPNKQFKNLKINNNLAQTFEIIKFIDSGSFGKVHLVQHIKTQSLYCLKTIAKSHIGEEHTYQLARQIIIQSYLNHHNIVNLYGFASDSENIYLLLQACPGQNLYKKLQKGILSEKQVRKYIKEVCSAVQYLHINNIIHRDIKPENIIIHQNTVKLCDFGWAIHSPYLRKTQCGTPVYTSPQMVKAQHYDNKIDIWSIGILTYELLFGSIPFQIRSMSDLPKIVQQQVFFAKGVDVSDQAKSFIKRCLQKNPRERISIRQALEDDFLTAKMQKAYRNTYS